MQRVLWGSYVGGDLDDGRRASGAIGATWPAIAQTGRVPRIAIIAAAAKVEAIAINGLRPFHCLFNRSDWANALLLYERQIARPQLVALAGAMIALELGVDGVGVR